MFKTNITISQWSSQNSPTVTPQTQPAAPQPQPQPQPVALQPQPLIVQAQPSHVLVSVPQAYPFAPPMQFQVQPQLYQTQPTLYQTQPSLYQNQSLLPQAQLPVPQIQAQLSAPPSPQPQLSVPQSQASLVQTQLSVSQTQTSLPQVQTPVPQTQPLVTQPSVPQIQASVAQPSTPPIQSSAPQPLAPHIQPSVPEAQSSNDSDGSSTQLPRKVNTPTGKKFGDIKSQSAWTKQRNTKGLAGAQATKKLQEPEKEDKQTLALEKEFKTLKIPVYNLRWTPVSTSKKSDNKFMGFKNPKLKSNSSNSPFKLPLASPNVEPSSVSATTPKADISESWLAALRENTNISELINDGDAEALKHLKDIRVTYPDDETLDFQLHFYFDVNDFFTDKELTKTYYFSDGSGSENDFVSVCAEGWEIHWKENKDLTKSMTDTSTVYKFDSFFDLFSSPTMPSDEDIENGNVDEGDLENLQDCLQLHFQIGEELKENIIPLVADYLSEKAPKYEVKDPNPPQRKGGDGDKNGNNKYENDDDRGNDVKDLSKRNIFSMNLPSQSSKFPSWSNKGEKDRKPAATGNTKHNAFSGFK